MPVLFQVVHEEAIPARQAEFCEPSHQLSPLIQAAMKARGMPSLFTHQAQVKWASGLKLLHKEL